MDPAGLSFIPAGVLSSGFLTFPLKQNTSGFQYRINIVTDTKKAYDPNSLSLPQHCCSGSRQKDVRVKCVKRHCNHAKYQRRPETAHHAAIFLPPQDNKSSYFFPCKQPTGPLQIAGHLGMFGEKENLTR